MRKLLLILSFLISVLKAEHIEEYHVKIDLESSGIFHITEDILYDFDGATSEKHGIYRIIPLKVMVDDTFIDIGIKNFKITLDAELVEVSKIKIGYHIGITIGSRDKIVSGKHNYRISYDVDEGILPSHFDKKRDMLFWNAIGDSWKVPILKVQVDLFLPEVMSRDRLSVLYPEFSQRYRWIDPHHLQAKIHELSTYSGFAVAIEFDRGILDQSGEAQYIKVAAEKAEESRMAKRHLHNMQQEEEKETNRRQSYAYMMWAIFLLFLMTWYRKRGLLGYTVKAKSLVVRYFPPDGLSLLQAGLLYDKFTDSRDFSAAILELANLKHILIVKENKRTFLLKRDRDTQRLSNDQKSLLDMLFDIKDRYEVESKSRVEMKNIQKRLNIINDSIYQWAEDSGYSRDNLNSYQLKVFWSIFAMIASLGAVSFGILSIQYSLGRDDTAITLLTIAAFIPGVAISFKRVSLSIKLIVAGAGLGLVALLISIGVINIAYRLGAVELLLNPVFFLMIVAILAIDGYQHTGHLTLKGMAVREYLFGLEEFCKRVKKDEIERLLKEDPRYIEKMLPYAMLFGQIDHWLKFYELLNLPNPKMSNGSIAALSSFSSDFSQVSYSASAGSSGSYGGGGFSGGGGGGGGGSW